MHIGGGAIVTIMSTRLRSALITANLLCQMGIVVTGAVVRVTSSGLGCPTWPQCVPGSLIPTSTQTQQWHKYVEFGNRMLTGLLIVVAVTTLAAVWRPRPDLRGLASIPLLGVFAQIVLGGVTVLTGLHPLWVGAHFLLSIGLIAAAAWLAWRWNNISRIDAPHKAVSNVVRGHTSLALLIVVVGILVTGSGPHAGDSSQVKRLPFDPHTISWLHADLAILFLGLTLGLAVALAATGSLQQRTAAWQLVAVTALQGTIGYVQYFTALPWALVAVHVLGAVVLWVAALRLRFTVRPVS